jgi:hypothetical protein
MLQMTMLAGGDLLFDRPSEVIDRRRGQRFVRPFAASGDDVREERRELSARHHRRRIQPDQYFTENH